MADVVRYTGTVTVNGETLVNGVEVTINDAYEVLTAEQAFGEANSPKELGPRSVDVGLRWRYDDGAGFTALWGFYTAGTEFPIVCTPVTGAGKNAFTINIKLSTMPLKFNAGQAIMCSANAICTDALGTVKTPSLVMTPAPGAITAGQAGAAYDAVTFACTGGAGTIAYTMTGFVPGMSLVEATGVFDGTPIAGSQGTYIFKVTATDDNGVAITQEYSVVIAAA